MLWSDGVMAVKVGIVGCGRVATMIHLPLLKRIKEVEVTAAVDIDENRLYEAVEKFHIDEGYVDHRRMLERAGIDAVLVCTPPETHFQIVMDSIKHGKHILCEKPIATTIKGDWQSKRRWR